RPRSRPLQRRDAEARGVAREDRIGSGVVLELSEYGSFQVQPLRHCLDGEERVRCGFGDGSERSDASERGFTLCLVQLAATNTLVEVGRDALDAAPRQVGGRIDECDVVARSEEHTSELQSREN